MTTLVTVLSAKETEAPDLLECEIVVTDYEGNAGETVLPFGWSRADPHGLCPAVTEWFDAHPDFPIQPLKE